MRKKNLFFVLLNVHGSPKVQVLDFTNTANSLYSEHCRDLELVSSLHLFRSNVCNFFLPGI